MGNVIERRGEPSGILDGNDEGGGLRVGTGGTEKIISIAGNNQADNEGRKEIKNHDTPEDLLGGLGEGLSGVGCFGGSETGKLRSTEGKCGGRENRTEALEGGKRTRVVPVMSSDVSALGGTTAVDHDSEDNETDDSDNFDETEDELDYGRDRLARADLVFEDTRLNFTITADTKELNGGQDDKEYSYPDTHIRIISPVLNGDARSRDFEW